ncbi:Small-conductance mechanosensitive channel [Nitrospina gracilis 3/211]|uniref:Small-conductance mechanosensitive channel n=1 Tax=Nitrospina gracilis (strain 3/211) TaxID=1266370 RepID=M1YZY0_NITG3|nr:MULTISPECIES: mechanosensitive ion channel domain-containing protein [Nitrospina]MCF8723925.1 small-conductance mechanosensitive channel [Nitrospina sp. Nb-3]CCQ91048.1 Small-conductance mechanosensitive channel [Nitrospina gracilis 3/211]
MDKEQMSKVFKTLDTAVMIELFLIVAGTVVLILITQSLLPWVANRLHGRLRLFLLAMTPLLRLVFILTAFILSVPRVIEPSLQNMVAVLGSIGLALGFALKDYTSSLIAGVVAVGERLYRNGDWIEVNGVYGEVTHVGVRTVRIVTPDDTAVYIPHHKLWTELISNANNGTPHLQCVVHFYLHPQHDAVEIQRILHDVALTSPYLYFDLPVSVVVQEKPWGTHYRLKAYAVDPRHQFRFITDLTVRGKTALIERNVRFALAPGQGGQDAPTATG